jgi:hypothetical protein
VKLPLSNFLHSPIVPTEVDYSFSDRGVRRGLSVFLYCIVYIVFSSVVQSCVFGNGRFIRFDVVLRLCIMLHCYIYRYMFQSVCSIIKYG